LNEGATAKLFISYGRGSNCSSVKYQFDKSKFTARAFA